MKNRIAAYEGKQGRDADLSASTRPDLGEPAGPTLTHTPGEPVLENLPITGDTPSPKLVDSFKESTILKIPKVPSSLLSPTTGHGHSILSPESLELTRANSVSPTPAKIRVRQDLMQHLGLVAKSSANIVQQSNRLGYTSRPVTTTTITNPSHSQTPNLAKLLCDPTSTYSVEDKPPVSIKSSNSQLFKSSESSGAIPLTFNNSIAEVLAAAANKAKTGGQSRGGPSPKPEITITAKSSKNSGDGFAKITKKNSSSFGGTHTPSGLSILKRTITSSTTTTTATLGGTTINPISNMTKLLQAQAPGLPPHVIAAQTLPPAAARHATPKVMSRPPGPANANFRPVQLSAGKQSGVGGGGGGGIQTVNKKSLTTVLDRLSTLTTGSPTKGNLTLSVGGGGNLGSSLVQQLQAPLVSSRSGPTIQTKPAKQRTEANLRAALQKSIVTSSPMQQHVSSTPPFSLSTTLSSSLPGNIIVPSSLALPSSIQLPSPLVQFPGGSVDPATAALMFPNLMGNQNIAAQNAAAAQAAINMMAATMSGMTQQQAVELIQQQQQQQQQAVEMLQQQQQLLTQQQNRMRAPPPLKNMGRKPD